MRQIVLFLVLILFSCKGQSVDTLEEIKNQEPITIEVLGQKIKTDSLGVNIFIPKRYLLNSKNKLKLIHISYYKSIYNPNNDAYIERDRYLNLNDTVDINFRYYKLISINEFKNLTIKKSFKNKENYKIINTEVLYNILGEFKKDEILFKYEYLDNPKELQVLSIPVNLE